MRPFLNRLDISDADTAPNAAHLVSNVPGQYHTGKMYKKKFQPTFNILRDVRFERWMTLRWRFLKTLTLKQKAKWNVRRFREWQKVAEKRSQFRGKWRQMLVRKIRNWQRDEEWAVVYGRGTKLTRKHRCEIKRFLRKKCLSFRKKRKATKKFKAMMEKSKRRKRREEKSKLQRQRRFAALRSFALAVSSGDHDNTVLKTVPKVLYSQRELPFSPQKWRDAFRDGAARKKMVVEFQKSWEQPAFRDAVLEYLHREHDISGNELGPLHRIPGAILNLLTRVERAAVAARAKERFPTTSAKKDFKKAAGPDGRHDAHQADAEPLPKRRKEEAYKPPSSDLIAEEDFQIDIDQRLPDKRASSYTLALVPKKERLLPADGEPELLPEWLDDDDVRLFGNPAKTLAHQKRSLETFRIKQNVRFAEHKMRSLKQARLAGVRKSGNEDR